jgi:hypothetical protein
MSSYPFTLREQDAIRAAGKCGFRYESETKKAIRFLSSEDENLVFNREFKGAIAFVVQEDNFHKYSTRLSGEKIGPRASSNFTDIGVGITRNGIVNNSGTQIQFDNFDRVCDVLMLT